MTFSGDYWGRAEIQDVTGIIADLEARRLAAMLASDVDALAALTSDRYIHIESTGTRRNKAEFLSGLATGEYSFDLFEIEKNAIFARTDIGYAVGTYRNVIRTPSGVGPLKHARHVRIYELESGVWRNTFHQATERSVP